MTEYSWGDLRDEAMEAFGEAPGAELEGEILEHFRERPGTVTRLVQKLSADIKKGQPIRSGWAVLRAQLRAYHRKDVIVVDGADKEQATRLARIWLVNAGCYLEKPDDVLDELFSRGILSRWSDDASLQAEMVSYWRALRPQAIVAEDQAHAYHRTLRPRKPLESPARGGPALPEDLDPAPQHGGDSP